MLPGMAHLVDIGDTRLNVDERGDGFPVICLHGGPGLDHHEFAHYLDALADTYRLLLVDQRSQGLSDQSEPETWTIGQMAHDVSALARALGLGRYAVLGHSYGAFVALQHAVDFSGEPAGTIVSGGLPSMRFLESVQGRLETFEPVDLRLAIQASWAREATVATRADFAQLMHDQLPFHFRDPHDPRIAEHEAATAGTVYAPDVLRHFAVDGYGAIEVEDRLAAIGHPVLVLSGRHDRVCVVEGGETIARRIPHAQLVVFEQSAHMFFVEEPDLYVATVRAFLDRIAGPGH
jgi:proline iminopeptidase